MRVAVVAGVGDHPLLFAGQPLRLEVERLLERLAVLEPAGVLLLVVRVGALDRVAQHRDHAHVGERRRDPRGHQRMEQVVRGCPRRSSGRCRGRRESGRGTRPGSARGACRSSGLPCRGASRPRRVGDQVAVERRGAAALGADDQEVGQPPARLPSSAAAAGAIALPASRDRRRQVAVVVVGGAPLAGHQCSTAAVARHRTARAAGPARAASSRTGSPAPRTASTARSVS